MYVMKGSFWLGCSEQHAEQPATHLGGNICLILVVVPRHLGVGLEVMPGNPPIERFFTF
jgi:hypothetical protein